jgi:C1A family cysteine protease
MPDHEHGNGRHLSHDEGQGRRLQSSDLSINWVELGKVGAVKSQGGCGSCWAFAATTAQEAMQAIKNDTTPVRLSE